MIESNPNAVSTQFEISGNHQRAQLVISNLNEQSEEDIFQY